MPMTDAEAVVMSPLLLAKYVYLHGKPIELWDHQVDLLWAATDHRRLIVLKARQLGVTETMALYGLWWMLSHPGQTVLIVSKGDRESKEVLGKAHDFYESMPPHIRACFPLDKDNEHEMRLVGGGRIISLPAGAGRSFTAHLLLMDEAAQWDHSDERMADVMPTAGDVGRIVIFSTARGVGNAYWKTWQEAKAGKDFHGVFYPSGSRPDRDQVWIEAERRRLGPLGPQEHPLTADEAFLHSGACDFDLSDLNWYLDHSCRPAPWVGNFVIDPISKLPRARKNATGMWEVWETPIEGRSYVITADSSGGGPGSDPSAVAIYDALSWDQVAAFHGRIKPSQLADYLWTAGHLYATRGRPSLLVPEANNHGHYVVADLVNRGYPRIYQPEAYDVERGGTRAGRSHGWLMNQRSKALAVGSLSGGLAGRTMGIRDQEAISEMTRFSGGEAEAGAHDDRVIVHALAAAVLSLSNAARPRANRAPEPPYWKPHDAKAGY